MIAVSAIGVSRTRSGPNSSSRPAVTLKTPPASATSSPKTTTEGSRFISSAIASLMASRIVSSTSQEHTTVPCRTLRRREEGDRNARATSPSDGAAVVASASRRGPRHARRSARARASARRRSLRRDHPDRAWPHRPFALASSGRAPVRPVRRWVPSPSGWPRDRGQGAQRRVQPGGAHRRARIPRHRTCSARDPLSVRLTTRKASVARAFEASAVDIVKP